MRELVRCGLWTVLLFSNLGYGESSVHHGAKLSHTSDTAQSVSVAKSSRTTYSAITPTFGNGTCPSRTANYITHTLPQQCLRTDRISSISSSPVLDASTTPGHQSSTGFAGAAQTSVDSSDPAAMAAEPASTFTSVGGQADTSQASASIQPTSTTTSDLAEESDSPLDNANFLSFEEWKKQNLAKAESEQGRNAALENGRPRPGINNALESLGDEGEIDLDFSGFGQTSSGPSKPRAPYRQPGGSTPSEVSSSSYRRSKDAGITCKERTNYASFDCAAQVLKHNPEVRSPYSLLVENKDSYMLNTCSVKNKFFIVELCNDVLVDTVVLANYEFFSSIFRHFRVSVSDRYPVKIDKWQELGTFEAKNTREIQAFLVEQPLWARYLRVEILSHYGSEYYCPISLLRVHGINLLEDARPHDESAQDDDNLDENTPELESDASAVLSLDMPDVRQEQSKEDVGKTDSSESLPSATVVSLSSRGNTSNMDASTPSSFAASEGASGHNASIIIPTLPGEDLSKMTCSTSLTSESPESLASSQTDLKMNSAHKESTAESPTPTHIVTASESDKASYNTTLSSKLSGGANNPDSPESLGRTGNTTSITASENRAEQTTASSSHADNATSVASETSPAQTSTSTNTTRTASSTSSAWVAPPQPSSQESFFKSLSKRLQQLESNSTLSLQYIEEQSRILRDAFSKVEKRQISSTSNFLANLNETVIKELQGFRQAYDQLWQSTVLELEGQREQYQREMLVLSSRLTLVADELLWQKRMGIVQSGLLLLCLGLVLFARTGLHGYLEVPLVQHMMNKSSTALSRAGWESPPASPSPENRSPVSVFRRKLWRSVTEPERVVNGHVTDGDVTGTDSRPDTRDGPGVDVFVEPPTPPPSRGTDSSASVVYDDAEADDEDEDEVLDPRESQSGPSTPTGTRDIVDRGSDMANGVLDHGVG